MKLQFLVIALDERRVLNDGYLSSNGFQYESNYYVLGRHCGTFDTMQEATQYAEGILTNSKERPEMGVEIRTIYTN